MKSCLLFALFLLLSTSQFVAQVTTLKGHIDDPKGKKVYLRHYSDYITYAEVTVDSGVINKKGDFKMTFDWPNPGPVTFYHGDEITELYLCPGDDLHLYLDTREFDETLKYQGRGVERNAYLAQRMLNPTITDGSVYKLSEEDFGILVDSLRNAQTQLLEKSYSNSIAGDNCKDEFLRYQQAEIQYEWAYEKLNYPMMHRYVNRVSMDTPMKVSSYAFLDQVKIDNPEALTSSFYVTFLSSYIQHEVIKQLVNDTLGDQLKLTEEYIVKNLKGDVLDYAYANMIYEQLNSYNDTSTVGPVFRRYKAAFPNGKYIHALDSVVTTISKLGTGNKAPDFTATDATGKSYSLNDFRGKIVYLDIWATWCGPCVAEIPNMEKLIDLFEGEDVVFLAVSVDDDQERWKKYIVDKKMQGMQLHSPGGFDSNISKQYAVVGIPRYVLIDKEGIIIEGNADRPGDMRDKLNSLLDE
ncbi:MAG TPA: TlpA disulfide reductase family protein [Saprospiraceae bacterium]